MSMVCEHASASGTRTYACFAFLYLGGPRHEIVDLLWLDYLCSFCAASLARLAESRCSLNAPHVVMTSAYQPMDTFDRLRLNGGPHGKLLTHASTRACEHELARAKITHDIKVAALHRNAYHVSETFLTWKNRHDQKQALCVGDKKRRKD